jgi:hypothetical protein
MEKQFTDGIVKGFHLINWKNSLRIVGRILEEIKIAGYDLTFFLAPEFMIYDTWTTERL